MAHEQRRIVRYNQLAAKLAILHNVKQMTRLLAELRDEGQTISPEVLAGLSPYRTAHINRYGEYTLDLTRAGVALDLQRRLLRSPTCILETPH